MILYFSLSHMDKFKGLDEALEGADIASVPGMEQFGAAQKQIRGGLHGRMDDIGVKLDQL